MEGKTEGVVGRIGAAKLKRFSGTSLTREATMGKKSTAPGIPEAVTHPSTNRARRRLTSWSGRRGWFDVLDFF